MNKKAEIPTLTNIIIAAAAFITIIWLCFNVQHDFLADNSITMNSEYSGYYHNITESKGDFDTLKSDLSDTDIITKMLRTIATTGNVFMVGLGVIAKMLDLLTIIPKMLSSVFEILHIPDPLAWFLMFVITVIGVSAYIRAARGTLKEP
jgi:hypothetical protein